MNCQDLAETLKLNTKHTSLCMFYICELYLANKPYATQSQSDLKYFTKVDRCSTLVLMVYTHHSMNSKSHQANVK